MPVLRKHETQPPGRPQWSRTQRGPLNESAIAAAIEGVSKKKVEGAITRLHGADRIVVTTGAKGAHMCALASDVQPFDPNSDTVN